MRIYEGSPRQDFEEVFRSIGAHLDAIGMRDILLIEVEDGFIIQGLVVRGAGTWTDAVGTLHKETVALRDDEISAFMDESLAKRGRGQGAEHDAYQSALRVIGRYLDEAKPRDVFFFEQDGSYVLRLMQVQQTGTRHELVEFTRDDIAQMIAEGPVLRGPEKPKAGSPG